MILSVPGMDYESLDHSEREYAVKRLRAPDLLNSRFAYVSISRASHEATLFTDDVAKLGPRKWIGAFDH